MNGYLSVVQAAGLIGISVRAVRFAITTGRLPASRIGHAWLIKQTDARAYVVSGPRAGTGVKR